MQALKYVLLFLLVIQLSLSYIVPLNAAYQYRIDYNLVKNNINDIDAILEQIHHQIEREHIQEYVIILGDSVAFSGPGPSSTSIGYYLENIANKSNPNNQLRVFNLAMPAMQSGDIYTMLLKLDQHRISSDHIIFDVAYAGFAERDPAPPAVFWLKDDLRDLDYDSFKQVLPHLSANNYKSNQRLDVWANRFIKKNVALLEYRDLINNYYNKAKLGQLYSENYLGDAGPWNDKQGLLELLQQPEYRRDFSTKPFDMTTNNPQIYFLDKIIEHQAGRNTLVFLEAVNEKLVADTVFSPGYIDNLNKIDQYFSDKPIKFLNLQGRIEPEVFSDWVHLTGAGYQELASILWENYNLGVQY